MDFDRRAVIKGAGAMGIAGLAGCTGGPSDSGGTPTETDTPGGDDSTATPTPEPTWVGMVYATGGLGDGSFNDQAQQGLFQADDEFALQYKEVQPEEVSEFKTFQRQLASSDDPDYDLVCCIGFLQTDALKQTSQSFPDQQFMLVDSVVNQPNVGNYIFKEHEGSFLVGQLAGALTTRDFQAGGGATAASSAKVGFVGGVESDLIKKFQAGYEAGVAEADGNVSVLTNYTGSFDDPSAGKEAALAMYNDGADVVYHAAGNTGTGVFQAAQEQGRFALGVDRDQSVTKSTYKDVILASMVKRVDTAVYNAISATVEGSFEGGTVTPLGLAEAGVDIAYGQQLGSSIPSEVTEAIASSKQAIIDGEQSVPKDPENV